MVRCIHAIRLKTLVYGPAIFATRETRPITQTLHARISSPVFQEVLAATRIFVHNDINQVVINKKLRGPPRSFLLNKH
jgi:hypothetical protein